MKKMKKVKILEFLILIVIIISIITIYFFVKEIFSSRVKESTSNEIKDYSKTKKYQYHLNLKELDKEKYILINNLDKEKSQIEVLIYSTDNYINIYEETITLEYIFDENKSFEQKLINHCNSYNKIEYAYQFTCTYKKNIFTYENKYKLTEINTDKIKVPITPNYKLNVFLQELDEKQINYKQVE